MLHPTREDDDAVRRCYGSQSRPAKFGTTKLTGSYFVELSTREPAQVRRHPDNGPRLAMAPALQGRHI